MASGDHLSLIVTKEPPEEWYNQQGGKSNFFEIQVKLSGKVHHPFLQLNGRRLPLKLELRYESHNYVTNQSILISKTTPDLDVTRKTAKIFLRITDVSKNHMKQPFRILIDVDQEAAQAQLSDDMPPLPDILPAETEPIRVLSKKGKPRSKRAKRQKQFEAAAMAQLSTTATVPEETLSASARVELTRWAQTSVDVLLQVQWRVVGYAQTLIGADGTDSRIDLNRPIYYCDCCQALSFSPDQSNHASMCRLKLLLESYKNAVQGTPIPAALDPANQSDNIKREHGPNFETALARQPGVLPIGAYNGVRISSTNQQPTPTGGRAQHTLGVDDFMGRGATGMGATPSGGNGGRPPTSLHGTQGMMSGQYSGDTMNMYGSPHSGGMGGMSSLHPGGPHIPITAAATSTGRTTRSSQQVASTGVTAAQSSGRATQSSNVFGGGGAPSAFTTSSSNLHLLPQSGESIGGLLDSNGGGIPKLTGPSQDLHLFGNSATSFFGMSQGAASPNVRSGMDLHTGRSEDDLAAATALASVGDSISNKRKR